MKKVYGEDSLGMQKCGNGFIILKKTDLDDRFAVTYKMISFDDNSITAVSKDKFQEAKFGKEFCSNIGSFVPNYVLCKAAKLDDKKIFVVSEDGKAKIINNKGELVREGSCSYKGGAPADILVTGNAMWASFPESNAIIRFNTRTMREELKIGGKGQEIINRPRGLWFNEIRNSILVCNEGTQNIIEISLDDFTAEEYSFIGEPIYQYIKVGAFEIVWTASGIYRL